VSHAWAAMLSWSNSLGSSDLKPRALICSCGSNPRVGQLRIRRIGACYRFTRPRNASTARANKTGPNRVSAISIKLPAIESCSELCNPGSTARRENSRRS
jgi:hypothetical protein